LLECRGVGRRFGGVVAFTGVDARIERAGNLGLFGPEGSGKTTLTDAITGFHPPQKGGGAGPRRRQAGLPEIGPTCQGQATDTILHILHILHLRTRRRARFGPPSRG
jgi:ABC-type branched-subunit amino acid transport system ATPase component